MPQKSKCLAIRARLEGSAPEVQVYWRRNERVSQFRFFVSRSPESIVSARAETRARANVGQSVGPLLRIGSTSAPRGGFGCRGLEQRLRKNERLSICLVQIWPLALAQGFRCLASEQQLQSGKCKPRKRSTPRRLTLPSSGLAPAWRFRPSLHSGPCAPCRREPLMSNVRRLRAACCKSLRILRSERALKEALPKSSSICAATKRSLNSASSFLGALNR